jgi:subtilisin family serine protease
LTRRYLLILVACCSATTAFAQGPGSNHVLNRLLAQRRNGANANAVNQALGANGALAVGQISKINVLILQVPEQAADRVAAALQKSGQFTFIEKDFIARANATPNDPYFSSQWHLSQIAAPSAWDISTGLSSITVAVIDSGAQPDHPDLASKLVAGWNFLTGTSNTSDVLSHGTGTAGTIAAASNNGTGVAGVAWANPIMPLVAVDSTGYASYSNIANAITYAADHGVRVINISISGSSSSSALQNAVNYAWNKGSVVVAAAGNSSSSSPNYPAACDNVVSVSATDSNDSLASFSNYGSWIDLAAPGVSVTTLTTGSGYSSRSGTSFSAPIVAGVAALVLSVKPTLSASSLVSLLEQNADNVGSSTYFGYGRVNAYRAVSAARGAISVPAPVVSISSPGNGTTISGAVSVSGTATTSLTVSNVQFFVDNQQVATGSTSAFSFQWNSATFANGSHTLMVNAYDSSGNMGSSSISVNVNNVVAIADTTAPTVHIMQPANGASISSISTASGQVQITVSATDNVAVSQVSVYIDGTLKCTDTAAPYTCTWNSKKVSSGPHTISATAWDTIGNSATASVTVSK